MANINLTWEAATTDQSAVVGYHIFRRGDVGPWEWIADYTDMNNLEYLDEGLEAGIEYQYYLRAVLAVGTVSEKSNTISITPDGEVGEMTPIDTSGWFGSFLDAIPFNISSGSSPRTVNLGITPNTDPGSVVGVLFAASQVPVDSIPSSVTLGGVAGHIRGISRDFGDGSREVLVMALFDLAGTSPSSGIVSITWADANSLSLKCWAIELANVDPAYSDFNQGFASDDDVSPGSVACIDGGVVLTAAFRNGADPGATGIEGAGYTATSAGFVGDSGFQGAHKLITVDGNEVPVWDSENSVSMVVNLNPIVA